jgi:hypothetical protein
MVLRCSAHFVLKSESASPTFPATEFPHFGDQNLWVIVAHGGRSWPWSALCFSVDVAKAQGCGLGGLGGLGGVCLAGASNVQSQVNVIKPIRFEELVQLV